MSMPFEPCEALDFLARWYGEAPRLLAAIMPDGPLEFRCFWPQQLSETEAWLSAKTAAGANIYYSLNQPAWALDKKAMKPDIRSVRAFHVDIDPDKNRSETPEQCKERALQELSSYNPGPSVIVDSGNGIQAMWLLDESITLDGTAADWSRVEAYNLALAKTFAADHCQNVDRIFRLPGTINFPNKKKRALGRVERPARLLASTWAKHPLSAFSPAPDALAGRRKASQQNAIAIAGSLPRYASTDDLPIKLDDYTSLLIVNGCDPADPSKYASRSEVLWRVLCDMVRAGADDETIAAVILDPDFKVSASVLDKPNPESHAAHQISKARDEAEHPFLRELNERHAVIESDRGGRCVVMEEDFDEQLGRRKITFQTFDHFRNRYMRRAVEIGRDKNGNSEMMPLGKWWLMQSRARQFRKIVFLPGGAAAGDIYNLWSGFGYDPRRGNGHTGFINHIRENLCDGNEVLSDYVIKWMARMMQEPGRPAEVALVIRGKKGTGKGFVGRALCRLLGQYSFHCSSSKYVTGNFNAHLRDCIFLFADEAFLAGSKQDEGILKALITEPTITIEAKGFDATIETNCLHLLIVSNEDYIVPASGFERRFVILQAADGRMQDTAYFAALNDELEGGGYENLLHYLLNVELDGFDHRAIPRTEALLDQAEHSMVPLTRWVFGLLDEAILPNNAGAANIAASTSGEHGVGLLDDANAREPDFRHHSYKKLASLLKKLGCINFHLGVCRGWEFPPLPQMRERFEREHGAQRWSDPNIGSWLKRERRYGDVF